MKTSYKVSWALQVIVSLLLLQTLFFKFTGAAEAVALFDMIAQKLTGSTELSSAMRIFTGVVELITAVLILIPRTIWMGALLAVNLMVGAIATHLFIVGIEVEGDGGMLFIMALVVFVASSIVLFIHRAKPLGLLK